MKCLKKLSSILCVLLMIMTFALTSISKVSAAPQSTTISKVGAMESYIGEHNKWAMFQTKESKIAYCMDVTKNGLKCL
jgi:hypothetical protein